MERSPESASFKDYSKQTYTSAKEPEKSSSSAPNKPSSSALMHKMLSPLEIRARGLTQTQKEHLEALITNYTRRTRKSKELTALYRPVLADSRAAVGFRFTTKEMLYPITGKYGKGARVWDIDGNEYVDITMGQGVVLFGHDPDFITDALKNSKSDRLLGPRPYEAGEAARLICELTGMERVTFTNTGTEAVMAAVRLARAATQRNKIVMFENAYHGHADNVMGRAVWNDNNTLNTVPVAPGITKGAVDDLWVLEYDTKQALDFIASHSDEIAAVIVEPVQSRRPDLQPREFLHELRALTSKTGIIFIFDEMITGFRVHQGGAQAVFGVKADIATYGKVLGGGMPIGVVAGRAEYMDAIDGGAWQYNDASYPKVNRTVFGGTFCQHPTAMITTLATLRHLKDQGPQLQMELNRKTKFLADELNSFFKEEEIPIEVVYFGSLFRFAFSTNLELLFYHLMVKGVFIWEWRNYFLCTAHTEADIAHIIKAVKESVMEMRKGGFLPEKNGLTPETAGKKKTDFAGNLLIPLTKAQHQLAVLARITPEGSKAYHVSP
ncbi:MAG: aminotransferase class III-fold pyridoxal phosphate-dependent enzyme, partial [Desulfamplus sp.]|nr:aminotransferase class III-fold pyridoxal phosphate-dependent enzyme [Desulfamplus sp.]